MQKKVDSKFMAFKSYLTANARFSPSFEMPILERVDFRPTRAIPFDKARNTKDYAQWVHFYVDDINFECLWRNPCHYLGMLKKFEGVITPDYSLYLDMPLPMQLWNTYRNRSIAYWLQSNDVKIVPNIRWGKERTYGFAFDGIKQGGTVAVGTSGCIKDSIDRYYFTKGLKEMINIIRPTVVVCYSRMPDDVFGFCKEMDIDFINIPNYRDTVAMKGILLCAS